MKRLFIILCSAVMAVGCYAAKEQSIAYIDMQYILKNLPQYESANEQLTLISKRWQKEIDALAQEARVLSSNYQTEQIFLSDEMRKRREEEIVQKEQQVALIKPIQDDIYAAIQELANEKKIDIVRDRSADPALIYMSGKLDISDQVLEKLGAK